MALVLVLVLGLVQGLVLVRYYNTRPHQISGAEKRQNFSPTLKEKPCSPTAVRTSRINVPPCHARVFEEQ